jgi:3-hydroxyacyl-CoA dehydrogenase
MNALDSTLFPILTHALDALHGGATGLVIGNDGAHFSVGANLRAMLAAAEAEDWRAIDKLIAEGQHLFLALRAAPKPVIATPFQRVLGGGAEICLAAHAVVAHAETTIGLVEFNVGLIPGWGGCKEMVRRHVRADAPLVGLRHILTLLTGAKSSASAHEAKTLGLLAPTDQVIMHRDYLLHAARQRVLELAQSFMPPTTVNNVYAAGPETMALLNRETDAAADAGTLLAHDVVIARAAIHVLCGGDEAGWHNEQRFLDLERQHFLQLIRTSATQTRIRHVLATGKPLRN